MADTDPFIREVDEEHRRHQAAQIWRRFGGLIVGLALLVIASVGGWRYWQHAETQRAQGAAARFEEAVRLSRESKPDEAEAALRTLAGDAPDGYRLLARLRLAGETGIKDPDAGAKAYDALAADAAVPATLQDLARLRAALLRLNATEAAAGNPDLERIAAAGNPWRHTAREVLGLAALRRGDLDAAGRWFDQIAADREAPAGLRSRLEIYTALVAGGPVQITQ